MTELLLSVKNSDEVRTIWPAAPRVIDLKNPSAGSLGRPDLGTTAEFRRTCHELRDSPENDSNRIAPALSIAMGELKDANEWQNQSEWHEELCHFKFCKMGISGTTQLTDWKEKWQEASESLPNSQLVMVCYLDWSSADSPRPMDIIDFAIAMNCETILFDTFEKQNGNLFQNISEQELKNLIHIASERQITTVLAGSIDQECIAKAISMRSTMIGIRGAICDSIRESQVTPVSLSNFLRVFEAANHESCSTK